MLTTWNIRGLNKIPKQKEVKRFIRSNKVKMIALLEHKIKEQKALQIIRRITPGWACITNYEYSNRGRIWILWDISEIDCVELGKSSQYIHTIIQIKSMSMRFNLTAIYGLHTVEERRGLWNDLNNWSKVQQGPWLVMGDYNAIRAGIDRALGNAEWMMQMPHLEVRVMDPGCSDHSPLCMNFEDTEDKGPKPFKFLNHLAKHKEFLVKVKEAWQKRNERNIMKDVWCRLKQVKQAMKSLNRAEYNAIGDKIQQCRQHLSELQEQMRDSGQPEDVIIDEKNTKAQLEKWLGWKKVS
ncbi:uncharacterized protein [Nicotiana sylvestris]|uniref:uncharacterized protein n=1 Tax=Nicotiana sylvestris TaxID=4096 RepID=UPI00388C8F68